MVLFYTFFGFLVLFFVAMVVWSVVADILRKLLVAKISQMSMHEIDARLSILCDELENCLSPKKKLEYELLLAEFYQRKKKQ